MGLIGIILAFAVVLGLVARGVKMAISLVVGMLVAGIFLPLSLKAFVSLVVTEIFSPLTMQLVVAVALIGGLGHLMKFTGDLDLIVGSLTAIFRSDRLLCMLMPAFFGTLNVPGGAIMSAPLVEHSAKRLQLSKGQMCAVNIFFRHIGYFIYPLYTSIIVISELLAMDRLKIIKENLAVFFVGLVVAYFVFFSRTAASQAETGMTTESLWRNIINLFLGFSPIIVMLVVVAVFDVPFYLGIMLGIVVAFARGLPEGKRVRAWLERLKRFIFEWADYNVALIVMGVMGFKGIIEHSGSINVVLDSLVNKGIPLPLLVVIMGLLVSYATGVHMAATGLLIPIFSTMFPAHSQGPWISLLFSAIVLGYIFSPLHLCLTFSNQYYKTGFWEVYRQLFWPALAMLLTAVLRVLI